MPRLKVMTLNLWGYGGNWSSRRNRLIELLQAEEVDVLLLQEVAERPLRPNQALELAMMTGYMVAIATSQRYFPWPSVASSLAILSRFPLSNQIATEISPPTGLFPNSAGERRICQRVEASLDGMSVVLYNTHFPPSPTERMLAAHRLWRQVNQEEAVLVVVGGDFHTQPNEQPLLFLQGNLPLNGMRGQLVDAWSIAGIGPAETFPIASPDRRIDYVFYQAEPSVIVQEARVLGHHPAPLSDHAAVVATFSISPSRDMSLPVGEEPVGSLEPTGGGKLSGF